MKTKKEPAVSEDVGVVTRADTVSSDPLNKRITFHITTSEGFTLDQNSDQTQSAISNVSKQLIFCQWIVRNPRVALCKFDWPYQIGVRTYANLTMVSPYPNECNLAAE